MIVHVRIDDRLLHGQVTHGWIPVLEPSAVIVADDRAASDEWERETYLAAATEAVGVRVLDLETTAAELAAAHAPGGLLLLVRGPIELSTLLERGFTPREAVVGGLHRGAGRVEIHDDLQVSPAEARAFDVLTRAGVHCYYQPLPADPPSELPDLSHLASVESGS